MKPLEPRLQAVADEVRAGVHADIGSDHALLPKYLLQTGRAGRVIVVEKNRGPLENAARALAGLCAEVRLGDGLGPLGAGEAKSLSVTGVGARLTVNILTAHPEKIPPRLVLQPNDGAEPLRRWALENGFGLANERMAEGFWRYAVLSFERGPNTAYEGLPLEVALRFGPLLLRQKHPLLREELLSQQRYFAGLGGSEEVKHRLRVVEAALEIVGG